MHWKINASTVAVKNPLMHGKVSKVKEFMYTQRSAMVAKQNKKSIHDQAPRVWKYQHVIASEFPDFPLGCREKERHDCHLSSNNMIKPHFDRFRVGWS